MDSYWVGLIFAAAQRGRHGLASLARNAVYRVLGVNIRGLVWMRAIEIPRNWRDVTLGHDVFLDRGVTLLCSGQARRDKLVIGAGTYVNRYTILDAHQQLSIGRNCLIGPHCYLTDGNHGLAPGVLLKYQPADSDPVVIEDDVWIGAGALVLPGVRIGAGAVVGAGSVVTRNVPANAVVAGVPARVLRWRHSLSIQPSGPHRE